MYTLYTTHIGSVIYTGIPWNIICMLMALNFTFLSNQHGFHQSSDIPSSAFSDIVYLANNNKLMLNSSKTEMLLIGTTYFTKEEKACRSHFDFSRQYHYSSQHIGSELVSSHGSDMSLTSQVNLVCKSSNFHVRDIRRIRNLIPPSVAINLPISCQLGLIIVINYILARASRTSKIQACTKFSCSGHHTNFKVSAHHF